MSNSSLPATVSYWVVVTGVDGRDNRYCKTWSGSYRRETTIRKAIKAKLVAQGVKQVQFGKIMTVHHYGAH